MGAGQCILDERRGEQTVQNANTASAHSADELEAGAGCAIRNQGRMRGPVDSSEPPSRSASAHALLSWSVPRSRVFALRNGGALRSHEDAGPTHAGDDYISGHILNPGTESDREMCTL